MRAFGLTKRRALTVIAPIAALTLVVSGAALAAGSAGHGRYGDQGSHFGWAFGRGDAPLGSVVSLSGTTLTVMEFDGVTQTFTVSDSTRYYLDGKHATSAAVVAGLNVVVNSSHYWGSGGGWGSGEGSRGAQSVYLISPNVLGNIQSVTTGSGGDTIQVLNPQGFAFTIQTSSTTNYWVNGSVTNTAPTFTTGEIIAALGVVDTTNRDQLDATQVNVVPKPPVRTAQTITFTSTPTSPTVGGTYTVTATGGPSGNTVFFFIDPSTRATCSIDHDSSLVSFLAAGTCTIDAFQQGNRSYLSATAQQSFTVAS